MPYGFYRRLYQTVKWQDYRGPFLCITAEMLRDCKYLVPPDAIRYSVLYKTYPFFQAVSWFGRFSPSSKVL